MCVCGGGGGREGGGVALAFRGSEKKGNVYVCVFVFVSTYMFVWLQKDMPKAVNAGKQLSWQNIMEAVVCGKIQILEE